MSFNITINSVGGTELGQTIDAWNVTSTEKDVPTYLLIGGVHGNEYEGIELVEDVIQTFFSYDRNTINLKANLFIVPVLNKDGQVLNKRSNINDVDLNRNIPARNWTDKYSNPKYKPGNTPASEKETEVFMKVIAQTKPEFIISCHSFEKSLLLYNSANGKFDTEVRDLSIQLNIPTVNKMDYSITGSLNSLSNDLKLPVLTVEAPRGEIWQNKRNKFKDIFSKFIVRLVLGSSQ